MRWVGIDVRRDFCEVAVAEEGHVRSAGRLSTQPDQVMCWVVAPRAEEVVTLEAMSIALAGARPIEPFARVVLTNPKAVKETRAIRAKFDARILAHWWPAASCGRSGWPSSRHNACREGPSYGHTWCALARGSRRRQ